MPECLQPRSIDEFNKYVCHLPVVIELKENGKKIYLLVQNHADFDADYAISCKGPNSCGGIFPIHEEMKRLAKKHGTPISEMEFESGKVWLLLEAAGYTKYGFKASESHG